MTDQTTPDYTAKIAERTVVITWPNNDRGGATPPPDGWADRAMNQEPTLYEIDEGSISGCSVLRWRDDSRPDAELIAHSLMLVTGKKGLSTRAVPLPPADRAAVLHEAADHAERLMDERYGPDCSYAIGGLDVARELRRMADETAARSDVGAEFVQQVDQPDAAGLGAWERNLADETATTDTQAEACPPGCIACATDESHDPAPAARARQDGADRG
ncbi:hypothetical protein [Streptomyces rochei]|uniref:hypothetical protein n=1 Tax=Streptomyces rochei TaxID=1928 RepID=UPI0036821ED9